MSSAHSANPHACCTGPSSVTTGTPQHVLTFKQAWLEQTSDSFRPAIAELYPNKSGLKVIFTLEDDEIFSEATGFNQETWKLGDVVEIFLGIPGESDYWELHVTPNNQRLQLAWNPQSFEDFRQGAIPLQKCMITDPEFIQSEVTVNTEKKMWQCSVFIPWTSIKLATGQASYELELAFCRYDVSRNQKGATLSSTAALSKASYHRRHEWDTLLLEVSK